MLKGHRPTEAASAAGDRQLYKNQNWTVFLCQHRSPRIDL